MVLEALVWKTSPGAGEVEPPVSGRGPWSTTVTRSQPRAVSSSARLAPTIPAPMMTTRGVVGIAFAPDVPVGLGRPLCRVPPRACEGRGQRGPSSAVGGGGELEGPVQQPVGQVAGEGRPD